MRRQRAISCLAVVLLSGSAALAKDPGPDGARADVRTARAAVGATGEGQSRTLAAPDTSSPAEPARSPTEPPPADLTEQAKQLYLFGAEAFAAQRNADAIGYFRQAERLVPSAKLTYNIALAYDEMGDTGRALSAYRAFLAREPGSVHHEEVQARIAKFELALAALGVQQLSVSSEPAGATLRVGEEIVGVTPWAGELTPGLHRIRLERPGYRAHDGQVALSAQHAGDLQVALQATSVEAPERPGASARIQPLTWCFLGVGVAALAGGVGFELSRASSSERAGDASNAEAAARAEGAADAKQMASLLLLGAGGAFIVGGGVLLILDLNRDTADAPHAADAVSSARLSVPCAPGFCGVLAQGQF